MAVSRTVIFMSGNSMSYELGPATGAIMGQEVATLKYEHHQHHQTPDHVLTDV